MNESKPVVDRREMINRIVKENASIQKTAENRENYFKSCEKHGGEIAEIVGIVRKEF